MKSIFIWIITRTSWGERLIIGNGEDTFVALFFLFMLLILSVPLGLIWWAWGGKAALAYLCGLVWLPLVLWSAKH